VTDADLTKVWEDFSTTSNWAQGIPCFTFGPHSGFPPGQCYSSIQGTSMAVPHVSATIALIASADPGLRHDVDALIAKMKAAAVPGDNHTAAIDTSDHSGGDLTGGSCDTGFCHLGDDPISDADAYGAGIVRATAAGSVR
jgi:subtilisin family serine protease